MIPYGTKMVDFMAVVTIVELVAWHSGRTSVSGRRTDPSAIGQPTRPTQPFILLESTN